MLTVLTLYSKEPIKVDFQNVVTYSRTIKELLCVSNYLCLLITVFPWQQVSA